MKKILTITLSAALLIAATAIILVSCKKDIKNFEFDNKQAEAKTEAQLVYEKIVKFREAREAYHSNTRTDNGFVSTSEARSILDAAINYEFSDISRYLEDTELDTLRYTAPATNADGNVAVNDLIDIYDKFSSNIGNDNNSVNYFMIIYPQGNTRNDDIEIVFNRSNYIPPTPPQPHYNLDYFGEDDNWIWGGDNGKCDIGGYSDAAQELTKKCQAMLARANHRNYGDTAINVSIHSIYDVEHDKKYYYDLQSNVNGLEYWLFHAENVPANLVSSYCITYDYMNLYLISLYKTMIASSGCFHYSPNHNSPIREVLISDDNNGSNLKNIWHLAELTYYKIGLPR